MDTEIVNKLFDEKPWEAEIMAVLFYMDGKQPVAIAQKGGKVVIPETEAIFQFTTTFSAEDFTDFSFREGIYRVQVVINGQREFLTNSSSGALTISRIILNYWILGL